MFNALIDNIIMKLYIARDKDGSLYIYKHKPVKDKETGYWNSMKDGLAYFRLNNKNPQFAKVKWTDRKATIVNVSIKIK